MSTFITILIIIAALLLVLLVLVQNSKGGGLASGFSSGNQVMGAPKTADFLEKATWTLVAAIVVLSIIMVALVKHQKDDSTIIASESEEAYEGEDINAEETEENANTADFSTEAAEAAETAEPVEPIVPVIPQ